MDPTEDDDDDNDDADDENDDADEMTMPMIHDDDNILFGL